MVIVTVQASADAEGSDAAANATSRLAVSAITYSSFRLRLNVSHSSDGSRCAPLYAFLDTALVFAAQGNVAEKLLIAPGVCNWEPSRLQHQRSRRAKTHWCRGRMPERSRRGGEARRNRCRRTPSQGSTKTMSARVDDCQVTSH